MKFKKSMLILILAVFLISIAGVCASDVNDTEMASQDSTTVELAQIDENDDISSADESQVVGQTDNQEIISADGNGTFAELESEIRSGYNSIITLGRDYEYEGSGYSSGIAITESITIDGQGHTINSKGKVNIFNVQADNVIIKNITFISSGGADLKPAIQWNYARGTVSDCVFINYLNFRGGAIYGENSYCNISGCVFTRNSAQFGGAVMWLSGQCHISDCIFEKNTAEQEGGALFLVSGCTVSDCIFVSNSATNKNGAAIYWNNNNCVVTNCYFVKNSGSNVVYSYDAENMAVNYNVFLDHNCREISFHHEDSSLNNDYNWFGHNATNYMDNPNVDGCSVWLFLNATANPDAISIFGSSDIVFKLYVYDSSGVSEFDNSRLKAINLTLTPTNGNVNITEVGLDEPVRFNPEDYGIGKITAKIENVRYTTTLKIADGTTFSDLNFVINGNNNDTIVLDKDYTYDPIFDSDLTEGIVINRPLTIVGNGHTLNATGLARIFSIQANNVVIENITFVNGNADRHGGAISWRGNNGNLSDCIFVNNSAGYDGGAVDWNGDNAIVSGCIFVNNSASQNGGAVDLGSDNGIVSGCSFVNNSARDGGAVTFVGYKGIVSGCSFVNNSASLDSGAIILSQSDESIVSNCSFVNNYADRQGGAISWSYTKDGLVSDCSFVNNSARDGGAIILQVCHGGSVSGCSFVNNSACEGDPAYQGGIIHWENYEDGNVSGNIFVNNRANFGIIYFDNYFDGHLSVNDNIFLNNDDVAIYFVKNDSSSNADYNWFGNNATNYDTEPVTTNTGITTWLFLNATADPDSISVSESSDILFKLYSYSASGVSDYDDSKLPVVNLTVTANNGDVDESIIALGDSVEYTYNGGGEASVTAAIENAEYTVVLDVAKANSILSADDLEMAYRDGSAWMVTLTDVNANPIANAVVKVGILGKVYNRVTDADGVASLPINLISGTYAINATFEGDGDYESSFADATVVVNRAAAVLTGYDLEM
uniref:right-handed parallel beta-helix repeat-containing protein n=1 Tax=Methanobrevibacter sp. TaxID=66852 RepID=UPI00388D5DD4